MRRAAWLGAIVCLGSCSPLVRVRVDFAVRGVATIDPARLHLRGRVTCDSHDLSEPRATPPDAPPPGLEEREDGEHVVAFVRDGTVAQAQFRASKCYLAITAFYDADGDGVVGPGDAVYTLPATEVRDRGLCAGNMNDLGTLTLERK